MVEEEVTTHRQTVNRNISILGRVNTDSEQGTTNLEPVTGGKPPRILDSLRKTKALAVARVQAKVGEIRVFTRSGSDNMIDDYVVGRFRQFT